VYGAGAWQRAGIETWFLHGQRIQQGIPVALSRRELGVWMWIRLWMKPEEDPRSLSCSDGLPRSAMSPSHAIDHQLLTRFRNKVNKRATGAWTRKDDGQMDDQS
jgi:hypothetical protein